jgi:two-component system response regulator VicR
MARIYVVDDSADVRHVVIYALMDEGHDILMIRDGEAAIEALISEPPDLVVLDLMLPGIDGFEILDQMRSWGIHDNTRTIVLTARASAEDRRRVMELGADDFVSKPFDPEELASRVKGLLRLSPEELRLRRAGADQARAISMERNDRAPEV